MDLELKSKEYLALLKVAYLADWAANAHAESPSEENAEISSICRRIYAAAEAHGFGELMPYDPAREDFAPSDEFFDEMDATFLSEHINRMFWQQLAVRLTDRIMDEKFGAEIDGWSEEKYRKERAKIEPRVEKELRENGLKNLFLLGDFSS